MDSIENSTVLISGASSGIGAALARGCAQQGAAVVGLMARNEQRLQDIQAEVQRHGSKGIILKADVTDPDQVHTACATFLQDAQAPDFLFVNAGIGRIERQRSVDLEMVRGIMEVNFHGAVSLLSEFLPVMEQEGGRVVVTSSIAAYRGLPGAAAYSASKAALDRYIEGIRVQYAGTKVSFLLVEPGFVRTALTEKNPFPMPFLLAPDVAATKILRATTSGKKRLTFPLPMALAIRALALLPDNLYDSLAKRLLMGTPKR